MKIVMSGFAAAVLLAGSISQPANAQGAPQSNPATLVHADSGVVVVQGAAIPVDKSMGANAGATVNALNGEATVTFNTGCAIKIAAREYTIPGTAPVCKSDVIPVSDTKPVLLGIAGAVAVGLAVGGGGGGSDRPSSP